MHLFKRKQPTSPSARKRPAGSPPSRRTNTIFSYHASRSVRPASERTPGRSDEQQPAPPARGKRWKRLGGVLLGIAIVGLLLSSLALGTDPKVVTVGDESGKVFLRDQQVYQQAAKKQLTSSIMHRSKLTIDIAKISEQLRAQFPELIAVSVSLPLLGSEPTVYIQPSRAALLLMSGSGTFVLDENGRAFITGNQAPQLQELELPVVRDLSGLDVQAEQVALPKRDVSFITEVAGQLKAKEIPIAHMILPAGKSELEVQMSGVPYTVRFNLRGNAREEAGAYLALKEHLEEQGIQPGEYIDVRVPGRAYYK